VTASELAPRTADPLAEPLVETELDVVVTARRAEAEGVVGLTLARTDGGALPAWTPGAHVELDLPGGLVRHYSLCGDPADTREWRIAVLREADGRGGSRVVADEVVEGTSLRIRGPRNHFPLRPAHRYVFVAGGIGITPLLPMVRAVDAAGADWVLHYGGRARASMAFLDQLTGDRVHVYPQDEVGLFDLDALLGGIGPDTLVYCCGPTGLIEAVEGRGLPGLHVERFTAGAVDLAGDTFEVVCERSGLTTTVPDGTTVLEAVRAAGVDVPSSCEEGICGTCETRVLGGEPDHRDHLLTDEEQAAGETMMLCVSRCRGPRLVLDL
jgi:ferredoxin-NADP reductase